MMKCFFRILTLFGMVWLIFSADVFAASYEEIGTEQVAKLLEKDKKAMLVFPLSQIEYEDEHIPGSVHIRLDALESKLPEERTTRLIFYGLGRMASSKAAEKAVSLGYTRVYHYREGLHGWVSAGYPTEAINKLPLDIVRVISTDEILEGLAGGDDLVLLDCSLESDVQKVVIDAPNRVYIPIEDLHERYTELPAEKDLAIICLSGVRSPTAARFLISKGFGSVMSVSGGTIKWIAENKPIIRKDGG